MAKLPAGLSHAAAYRKVRTYAAFKYPLSKRGRPTASQKRKVTELYGLIYGGKTNHDRSGGEPGLESSPRYHLTKRLTKAQRRVALEYARIPTRQAKLLRGVLIPVAHDGHKPKITFSKTKGGKTQLTIGEGDVTSHTLSFEDYEEYEGELQVETEQVVRRALKDDPKGKRYRIVCGKGQTKQGYSRNYVEKRIAQMIERYDETEKWLTGIIGYSYKRKISWDRFNRDLAAGKVIKQKSAKAARRGSTKKKRSTR